jgi:TRAP-type C4-dicarboxylate transport system permease small subunit
MPHAEANVRLAAARILDRLSRDLNTVVEALIAVVTGLMVAIVAAQVFARYVLNHSLFWSEELARYLLVWLAVLGATAGYRRGLHPALDLFQGRLGPAAARVFRISTGLICLFFFILLVYYGTSFAYFVRTQISPALQLPKWIVLSILPLGGAVFALHALALLLKSPDGERS